MVRLVGGNTYIVIWSLSFGVREVGHIIHLVGVLDLFQGIQAGKCAMTPASFVGRCGDGE